MSKIVHSVRTILLVSISVYIWFANPSALYAEDEDFGLYTNDFYAANGGVAFDFDPSGYSDGWWWGVSDRHLHWESGSHETLSGEFAAAVYFSGIRNNKAMWLEQYFRYPYWYPDTDFNDGSWSAWNDPCNPIDACDTAWSFVEIPNQIRVTMDYKLVDLGEYGYSPLSFIDANGNPVYVKSEQWVCVITYTIKNIRTDQATIEDIRFFQFLHAHPTDTPYPAEFSSYCSTNYPDALKGYDPENPNLNFRYDITQWRSGDPNTEHVDWIGISSTIEPNNFENGVYVYGNHTQGETTTNIENLSLNGEPNIAVYEAAGAMEWDFGDLEWNAEKKITITAMFGCGPIVTCPVWLEKTDDTNGVCVSPYNEIEENYLTYEICYDACGFSDPTVFIVDYLPDEVEYYSHSPMEGPYHPQEHSVEWSLREMGPNDTNCFTVTVKVTEAADPGSDITNLVHMYGNEFSIYTSKKTCVECWAPPMFYVDADANGLENGTSWENAFINLQDALEHAVNGACPAEVIWVAAGTYKPIEDMNIYGWEAYSFELFDDLAVFGHFEGNETDPNQRDLSNPAYETILQGEIEQDQSVTSVVTADGINDALVDGFSIAAAATCGVHLFNDCNVVIANCQITGNGDCGIRLDNNGTYAAITNCTVTGSDSGILLYDYASADISNCTFSGNDTRGLYVYNNSQAKATGCLFDGDQTTGYGLYIKLGSDAQVDGCNFINHTGNSIYASSGSLTMSGCNINETTAGASAIDLSSSTATITNCSIENSGASADHGIVTSNSSLTVTKSCIKNCSVYDGCGIAFGGSGVLSVTNNWIYGNYIGIYIDSDSVATIRNNTIVNNNAYGIYRDGGTAPNISNCIIWNPSADDLSNCTANYSCISDCNDAEGEGNICGYANNPCFVYADGDNYHIKADSNCRDVGTGTFSSETDIDGEPRTAGIKTDMGADEYYWPKADYDRDETVNFKDYALFAEVWLSTNEPNISLDADNDVETDDLDLFSFDWLWESAWGEGFMMFCMGGGFGDGLFMSEQLFTSIESIATSDGLMIPDVSVSLAAMPDSVYAKAEKFYAINAYNNVHAIRQAAKEFAEFDVKELTDWLDKIWESGDLDEYMTEADYLEFREAILD